MKNAHWIQRYEALPKNRQQSTVKQLRTLILEMHDAGLSCLEIGVLLKKDHSTITHHLLWLGISSVDEKAEQKKVYLRAKIEYDKQQNEIRSLKRQLVDIHQADEEEASRMFQERQSKKAANLEKAWKLRKQGKTQKETARLLNLSQTGVFSLLRSHPDFKAEKKLSNVEVAQCDMNGEEIQRFPSVRSAARFVGIANPNISLCLSGQIETAGGFKWKRVNRKAS